MLSCLLFQAPNESQKGASCHNRLSRLMNLVNLKASFKLALSSQANLHPLCNCIYNWLDSSYILLITGWQTRESLQSSLRGLPRGRSDRSHGHKKWRQSFDDARHVFITILFYALVFYKKTSHQSGFYKSKTKYLTVSLSSDMNALITYQTQKMKSSITRLCSCSCISQNFIFSKLLVIWSHVNSHNILEKDSFTQLCLMSVVLLLKTEDFFVWTGNFV